MFFRSHFGRVVVVIAVVIGFYFTARAVNERITNEVILDMIRKSRPHRELHEVMVGQKKRLNRLMDAFIVGDAEGIRKLSHDFAGSLSLIARNLPETIEDPTLVWRIMSEIVKEATLLSEEANKNDYYKAYLHFSAVTMYCVHCHQGGRLSGKLPRFESQPVQTPPETEKGCAAPPQ